MSFKNYRDLPLPPDWECKTDLSSGQIYYVDHCNKITTWDDPRPVYYLEQKHTSIPESEPKEVENESLASSGDDDFFQNIFNTREFQEFEKFTAKPVSKSSSRNTSRKTSTSTVSTGQVVDKRRHSKTINNSKLTNENATPKSPSCTERTIDVGEELQRTESVTPKNGDVFLAGNEVAVTNTAQSSIIVSPTKTKSNNVKHSLAVGPNPKNLGCRIKPIGPKPGLARGPNPLLANGPRIKSKC